MSNRKDNTDTVDLEQYRLMIVGEMLKSIFHIIRAEEQERGSAYANAIFMSLVSSMVATKVFDSLANPPALDGSRSPFPPGDKARQYEIARESFGNVKAQLADAIATGFTGGFINFSPESGPTDYYVSIVEVPDPINTLPA